LSAKLDKPVLTNIVGLAEAGGKLQSEHAIFGGNQLLHADFTAEGPGIFVIRAKSFPVEESGGGAPEVVALAVPDLERPARPRSSSATSRSAPAPNWTRRPSSCRAGGAWARRPSTR